MCLDRAARCLSLVRFAAYVWGRLMPFRLPTFNLTAHLWRNNGVGGAYASPDLVFQCNLTPGKRTLVNPAIFSFPMLMDLLAPKGTDLRADWNNHPTDCVEIPAGSRRFYTVRWVDDVAKGFANEYRIACIAYTVQGNGNFFGPNSAPEPMP